MVDPPIDESAADVAVEKPLFANAAEADAGQTYARSAGSTFLEVDPQVAMTQDPFEEEAAPGLPPSDESTTVAISDPDDSSLEEPQLNQPRPDAPPLAASDTDIADGAEDSPPDGVAPRSSDLPFATTIARLPMIDPQLMDEDTGVPQELRETIRRCLEVAREQRFQDVADLKNALLPRRSFALSSPSTPDTFSTPRLRKL